jgi:hypothetical protein
MPFDAWENAALIDTGEAHHIALVLSPDGGSTSLQLYIGEKGRDADGSPSSNLLARNGLAYGSWYYLEGSLPETVGEVGSGTIGTSSAAALSSTKLEDIDTSPSDQRRVVLGDQELGVFTFDFQLVFAGAFAAGVAGFSVTKISDRSDSDDAAVSAGSLGQFASHTAELCSAGRRTTAKIAIPYHERYYLVVPIGAAQEGSYVTDSVGVERPAGITSCRLHQVESPCP